MTCGGTFITMSFFCAGLLQMSIDRSSDESPRNGRSKCVVFNESPCDVFLRDPSAEFENRTIPSQSLLVDYFSLPLKFRYAPDCIVGDQPADDINWVPTTQVEASFPDSPRHIGHVFVIWNPWTKSNSTNESIDDMTDVWRNSSFLSRSNESAYHVETALNWLWSQGSFSTSSDNPSQLHIFMPPTELANQDVSVSVVEKGVSGRCDEMPSCIAAPWSRSSSSPPRPSSNSRWSGRARPSGGCPATWSCATATSTCWCWTPSCSCACCTALWRPATCRCCGGEFASSQAVPSMRSTVHALWLFQVVPGNLLCMFLLTLPVFEDAATLLFSSALIMMMSIIVFVGFAINYTYVDRSKAPISKSSKL